MPLSRIQWLYGLLSIVGAVVTWYFNLQPRDVGYVADLYATSASASFTNDLIVVVITFLIWAFTETKRLGMSLAFYLGIFVFTFVIAASTVPLFMLVRENYLRAQRDGRSN